jgi:hypothetical protein
MDEQLATFQPCEHESGKHPTVEISDGSVFIRDNFGGEVRLSLPQLEILLNHPLFRIVSPGRIGEAAVGQTQQT